MSINRVMLSLGCVVAWFVVLPAFLIVFTGDLLLRAVAGELADQFRGATETLDPASARRIASRMCMGTRTLRSH